MKSTRQEVYKVLDGERDYQDSYTKDKNYDDNHSTAEHLVLLRTYLSKAEESWCHNHGDQEALRQIRKIAGIAVRCMEENGAISR